jgi:hypothetical protein
VLAYLEGGHVGDRTLIQRSVDKHEAAIGSFHFFLPSSRQNDFKRDCEVYRKSRQYSLSQEGFDVFTPQQANELKGTIEKLLSYASG